MKLATADISGFLHAPAQKTQAVLIYGPDDGLVRERAKSIAAKIVADPSDPFNVVELTEEKILAHPPRLRDELAALSLMGGQRLVMVRDAGDKLATIIREAFEGLNESAYLIVLSNELTPRSALRLLFEKETRFAALACYKEEGRTLDAAIRNRLQTHGLWANPEAISYLTHHLGNDRGVTLSELEKLAVYMGDVRELSLVDAEAVIGENIDHSLDDVCQAVAGRDPKSLETALMRLTREGIPAIVLLRALIKYFQRLHYLNGLVENGQTIEEAVASLRPPVFFKQVTALKRHLSLWPRHAVVGALDRLLRVERSAKSGLFPQETLCHHLFVELACAA